MNSFGYLILISAVSISGTGLPAFAQSTDEDGCYQATNCLSYTKNEWLTAKGHFMVAFRNNCSKGIYAKMCIQKTNGSWDCGSSHINPGSTASNNTYNSNGKSEVTWVGSARIGSDWVCAGKISGWYDFPN